jgi:hypothetical protein
MCAEPIVLAELFRDFHRELLLEASLFVDHRKFVQLVLWLIRKLSLFALDVRLLCATRESVHLLYQSPDRE